MTPFNSAECFVCAGDEGVLPAVHLQADRPLQEQPWRSCAPAARPSAAAPQRSTSKPAATTHAAGLQPTAAAAKLQRPNAANGTWNAPSAA